MNAAPLFPLPKLAPHPARYSVELLPHLADLARRYGLANVLDPFAGVGGIHELRAWVPGLVTTGIEIEPEWANASPYTRQGDALALPFPAGAFDGIVTSPTYANRMADNHNARDDSRRNTYRHRLGRPLHPHNSGALQWGERYRLFHLRAWTEAARVLAPGGLFVLNCKDHIRAGKVQPVTAWHVGALGDLGFVELERIAVECPGNRYGQNGHARIDHEWIIALRSPEKASNQ